MKLPTIFGAKTVDSILANFETQQNKLRALAIKLQDAAKCEQEKAAALKAAAEAKDTEADRAYRVAQKIAELVG